MATGTTLNEGLGFDLKYFDHKIQQKTWYQTQSIPIMREYLVPYHTKWCFHLIFTIGTPQLDFY